MKMVFRFSFVQRVTGDGFGGKVCPAWAGVGAFSAYDPSHPSQLVTLGSKGEERKRKTLHLSRHFWVGLSTLVWRGR